MTIEDLRSTSIDFGSEGMIPATSEVDDGLLLLAQAGSPVQNDATQVQEIVVTPDANNVATLPPTATIDEIKVDGSDLVLVQPDGSLIRIAGGALNIPTFMIGDVVVEQEVLLAVLDSNDINVAAGPDGTLSVAGAGPQCAGR